MNKISEYLTTEQVKRKNRLERIALLLVALAFIGAVLFQKKILKLGTDLTDNQGLATLITINITVLLSGILLLLILRSFYRIFFERHFYSSLQIKMVIAFVSLSLLPTIIMFYYSYRTISKGHDLWFSPKIEQVLSDSLALSKASIEMDNRTLSAFAGDILDDFLALGLNERSSKKDLDNFFDYSRKKFHLAAIMLYNNEGKLIAGSKQIDYPESDFVILPQWFKGRFSYTPPWLKVDESEKGDLTTIIWPLFTPTVNTGKDYFGFLAISKIELVPLRAQIEKVHEGLVNYQSALKIQKPIKATQLATLAGVTLLAVFISVWIGSHLAASLANPVLDLVEGTKKIARGDLDYTITLSEKSAEWSSLVSAFNQMTKDLKNSYTELDQRRRFVETVLSKVSTGVVVIDHNGLITTINKAALDILRIDHDKSKNFQGEIAQEILPYEFFNLINLRKALPSSGANIKIVLDGNNLSIKLAQTILYDEEGQDLGVMLAFDDLTELEKMQRMAAWREVAKRIAHEVKNPLTPIQLSAQRLRRKFSSLIANDKDGIIFDECTQVIIKQVEEMKNLVDEFSQFARLPETKLVLSDLTKIVAKNITLFSQAHKDVQIVFDINDKPPLFYFDPEQISRVITNILENSVVAMNRVGKIKIVLELDKLVGVRLLIFNDGPKIDPAIKDSIFEPYVTNKDGGQGLGLAIVKTIINDHGGYVRAENILPEGVCFTIELPLRV